MVARINDLSLERIPNKRNVPVGKEEVGILYWLGNIDEGLWA